jgi:hypothetical protein
VKKERSVPSVFFVFCILTVGACGLWGPVVVCSLAGDLESTGSRVRMSNPPLFSFLPGALGFWALGTLFYVEE